jgi:hypothetical protein
MSAPRSRKVDEHGPLINVGATVAGPRVVMDEDKICKELCRDHLVYERRSNPILIILRIEYDPDASVQHTQPQSGTEPHSHGGVLVRRGWQKGV